MLALPILLELYDIFSLYVQGNGAIYLYLKDGLNNLVDWLTFVSLTGVEQKR